MRMMSDLNLNHLYFNGKVAIMSDVPCLILDDDELEKQPAKINPQDMRQWLPDTLKNTRPFENGFIKTAPPFPKAFQGKKYDDDFPPLHNLSTPMKRISVPLQKPDTGTLLEKVRSLLAQPAQPAVLYEPKTPPFPPSPKNPASSRDEL